jgi:hypothetical protein
MRPALSRPSLRMPPSGWACNQPLLSLMPKRAFVLEGANVLRPGSMGPLQGFLELEWPVLRLFWHTGQDAAPRG